MKNVVYTPEFLGGQPIELDTFDAPYQLAVFSYLTVGGLRAVDERHLLPISTLEQQDAVLAVDTCHGSVTHAIDTAEEKGVSRHSATLETLYAARRAFNTHAPSERELYDNCYGRYNHFAEYVYTDSAERRLLKAPIGIRDFVIRARKINQSIIQDLDEASAQGRRFNSIDELAVNFPGLNIPTHEVDEFEARILDVIHNGEEMPNGLTAKQADKIISLVGGGTLLNALERKADDTVTEVENKITRIARMIEMSLGRGSFRATALGRTAWGTHSIRLRSGDTIPRVTLPKPGI